ncbi:PCSK5 [Mytilus edulis]|uniref:PCSK5 n=1 Tax=Mytilus edulis TaxID=6550 RepID=A0A8S3TVE2_MYTED|nr:PCSK5 [Mytilus edulis]
MNIYILVPGVYHKYNASDLNKQQASLKAKLVTVGNLSSHHQGAPGGIIGVHGSRIHMCSAYYVNQFAVHIKGGSVTKANNLAKEFGFINHGQIGTINEHYLFEHHDVRKRSTDPSLHHHSLLSEHPEVHWVEQQYVHRRTKRDLTFNDPEYKNQWYLHEGGKRGTAGTVGYDMNVKRAWEMGYTGKGVIVTILDDGIERDHPDLIKNYDPYASYDVNNKDSDPMPRYDPTNENRHGTRCAGEVSA